MFVFLLKCKDKGCIIGSSGAGNLSKPAQKSARLGFATQVVINFVDTDADACAFLEEECECYESFQCLKPISEITTNGIKGFTMTYATKRHIYEEYTFNLPGEEPTLLNICIEQKKYKQADPTQYAQLVVELLSGIALV